VALGNISTTSPGHIAPAAGYTPTLVAALGFIEVPYRLHVENDLVLFAVGDLFVRSMTTNLQESTEVTLISATGTILVTELTGAIKLRAYGYRGVFVPSGFISEENSLLPRMRRSIVARIDR